MRAARSADDPRRTVMLTARIAWPVLQEAAFQAWCQLKSRTAYVIEAIVAHNERHRDLPSKRRDDEVFKP